MAVRGPDPHNLRNAALKVARIEGDRECPGCGYNLRGLPLGAKCPECGMDIIAPHAAEIDDPLSLAPTRVIVAFIRGCWAASIIIALVVVLVLARGYPDWNPRISNWGLLGLSVLWVGAVLWLTPAFGIPQAAARGFSRRGRVRVAARWLQLGWPLAAAMRVVLTEVITFSGPTIRAAQTAGTLGFVAGLAGVVLLSILLERLSDWARDDRAQNLFNWATWTLPVVMLLQNIQLPLPAVNMLIGAIWLIGVGLFPYALISLSSSVTLSVVHAHEHRQREQRRAERRQRYGDEVERTVRTMDAERQRRGHV